MIISLVLPHNVDSVWGEIEGYMQGAAKYTFGRYSVTDIKETLTNNNMLWLAFDNQKIYGAVITEIVSYPQMDSLVMHFTGGIQLELWKAPMLAMLQRFAKDKNCSIIESYGRKGWAKVFEQDGFKQRFMYYELPV